MQKYARKQSSTSNIDTKRIERIERIERRTFCHHWTKSHTHTDRDTGAQIVHSHPKQHTHTSKINGICERFSTADSYHFTTGTPSERFPCKHVRLSIMCLQRNMISSKLILKIIYIAPAKFLSGKKCASLYSLVCLPAFYGQ
jgi:hypothetical protein